MPAEKSLIDKLLERMRQQLNEQQQKPEQSYFADKPEPDREQERRQAAIRREEDARRQAAKVAALREGPGRPLTAEEKQLHQQFKDVTLAREARREQEIALKFRHEETRAAALQVMLDADEARDEADQRLYDQRQKFSEELDRLPIYRPIPEDYGRDYNERNQKAVDRHRHAKKQIELDAEAALAKIQKIDNEITVSQMPILIPVFQHMIEDKHTLYPPPGGFNREAYDPWDVGTQFADAAAPIQAAAPDQEGDPESHQEPDSTKPDYVAIFEMIARSPNPSPGLDPDGPSFGT